MAINYQKLATKIGQEYFNYPDLMGILWIGSTAFGIQDDEADIDIRLLVNHPNKLNPMKQFTENNIQIESAGIKMRRWLPTDMGRDQPSHRLSNVYEPDAIQWAFCMLRKEAALGNLDENTFHGFRGWDDIDNCFVLKKKGWKVYYCGAGAGFHEPRATRGDDSPLAAQENRENGVAFYKRWGFWDEFVRQHGADAPVHTPPKPNGTQPAVKVA